MKPDFDQVIALIIVVGALALIFCGINTEVKSVLSIAAGWAFGSAFQRRYRNHTPPPPPPQQK